MLQKIFIFYIWFSSLLIPLSSCVHTGAVYICVGNISRSLSSLDVLNFVRCCLALFRLPSPEYLTWIYDLGAPCWKKDVLWLGNLDFNKNSKDEKNFFFLLTIPPHRYITETGTERGGLLERLDWLAPFRSLGSCVIINMPECRMPCSSERSSSEITKGKSINLWWWCSRMALRNRKTHFSKETKIVGKGRKKELPSDGWNPYGLVKKKKKRK